MFDEAVAARSIGFIEDCLSHIEGELAGQPFLLELWQRAIIANIFGWKRPDGTRRYREVFIFVPIRNGKTMMVAAIALVLLFQDGEPGAQVYSAAADYEQANLCFRFAKGMIANQPALANRCKVYQKSIVLDDGVSFYKALSAEHKGKHGLNAHGVIIDEEHVVPRQLVEVLKARMGSRKQPLLVHLTTSDYERPSVCNDNYDYACKVRDGQLPKPDPAFLPVIYEAATEDDWTSEKVWFKANPNLGKSKELDMMRRRCALAQEIPSEENTFKRFDLNIRTEQAERWLTAESWDACAGDDADDPIAWRARMIKELTGQSCTGGLDLGSTRDLTALALWFDRGPGEPAVLLPWFWIPETNAKRREDADRVPYLTWARQGFITLTDGNVIDYDVVREDINELGQQFGIRKLAVDRLFQGAQLMQQLQDMHGFDIEAFGQGFISMALPTKELERLVLAKTIRHGGHPVLQWMARNVAVEHDAAGNIKPSKKISTERIDGIVATVMALAMNVAYDEEYGRSVYEDKELVVF